MGEKGAVHAFEPAPSISQRLRQNVKVNNFANIFLNQAALSSRAGTTTLYVPDKVVSLENGGSSSLRSQLDFVRSEKVTVDCLTIDKYCRSHSIKKIDVLKIDTEGAELFVLKGAQNMLTKKKIGVLIIEYPETRSAVFGYRPKDMIVPT